MAQIDVQFGITYSVSIVRQSPGDSEHCQVIGKHTRVFIIHCAAAVRERYIIPDLCTLIRCVKYTVAGLIFRRRYGLNTPKRKRGTSAVLAASV